MGIAMFLAGPVCAKVTGVCGNCHTMHNSQNNVHMMINTDIDGTSSGPEGGGYPSLTRGSCVGCHTGSNPGTQPFVYNTGAVTYGTDTLAGGNFKWVVTEGDAKGHNVKGIPGLDGDATLSTAPGDAFGGGCANSCHNSLFTLDAGSIGGGVLNTGCQGCHLAPKHHAPQQAVNTPALADNGFFRFLSSHQIATDGVEGIEDADWQLTEDASDHNEYLGKADPAHTGSGGFANIGGHTMTAYCTGCHGNFHTQLNSNSDWIRHPSDAVLPTTGEYTNYTSYKTIAPVARPTLAGWVPGDAPTVTPGTDLVMCLSCHRAHGSPYNDMLRWDYEAGTVAGGGGISDGTGCFVCHTEKDH
jgi:hypothetical protein